MRDRAAKLFGSTSDLSPRSSSGTGTCKRVNSGTGTRGGDQNSNSSSSGRPAPHGRILRRCDSAASLSTSALLSSSSSALGASNNGVKSGNSGGAGGDAAENQGGPSPFRKQGTDFLVEVEGKMLNVFGQGGLRHALTVSYKHSYFNLRKCTFASHENRMQNCMRMMRNELYIKIKFSHFTISPSFCRLSHPM